MPTERTTTVSLSVLDSDRRAGTRMGRRRAIVLVLVHVLIGLHILLYLKAGSTLSPLEPSEASYSIRDGAINAGAAFLVLMVLSTLVFGRFFCGWACHLVALQDACRWLLVKVGLRPRPVRARLLMLVPLFGAYWLYGRPLVSRLRAGDDAPGFTWHLTTDAFWATFPGPAITVLTFLVCGFVIVYVLGAKGFCSYGCPYGALFGIADRPAKGRIRVNEDCDQTGDCTRNCSSNVDVAREVALHGMVVDPGCMKCMDCVAGCPNQALSFSFVPRVERPQAPAAPPAAVAPAAVRGALACYAGSFVTLLLLLWNPLYQLVTPFSAVLIAALGALPLADVLRPAARRNAWTEIRFVGGAFGALAWTLCGSTQSTPTGDPAGLVPGLLDGGMFGWGGLVGALVIAVLLRLVLVRRDGGGGAADFTWAEELALVLLFAAVFWVSYRLYRVVPFLMALGVASMGAALLLTAVRLAYAREVVLQRLTLRRDGRLTGAGGVFAGIALLVAAASVHGGVVQWHTRRAVAAFDVAYVARVEGRAAEYAEAVERTAAHLERCVAWSPFPIRGADRMAGELARWRADYAEAIAHYDAELSRTGFNPAVPMYRGIALFAEGRPDEARASIDESLAGPAPPRDRFLALEWELGRLLRATPDRPTAEAIVALRIDALRRGHAAHPADPQVALALCRLLARPPFPDLRDADEALAVAERTAEAADPPHADLLGLLAWLHGQEGRWTDAVAAAEASVAAARAAGDDEIAAQMEEMADHYRRSGADEGRQEPARHSR